MLKTFLSFAFTLLVCNALSAQTIERDVLANAGGSATLPGIFTLSWTLGETFVATQYAHECVVILTEGFQQRDSSLAFVCPSEYAAMVEDPEGNRISIFPNPTKSTLTIINIEHLSGITLHATLTDAAGRTLRSVHLSETTTVLDLNGLPPAYYFLSLTDGKDWITTVKVMKQ